MKQGKQYDFEGTNADTKLSWKVALTPNPASEFVSFKIEGIESEEVISFSIQNTDGKVVLESQIQNVKQQVNLSDYLLKFNLLPLTGQTILQLLKN